MKVLTFLFMASSVFLFACSAGMPNQNLDPAKNNQVTYRKDLKECQEDYPVASSGVHVRQWENCMNLKGWR